MEFSRQEYWSGLPFLSPGDLPDPGIELGSPALQVDSISSEPRGKSLCLLMLPNCISSIFPLIHFFSDSYIYSTVLISSKCFLGFSSLLTLVHPTYWCREILTKTHMQLLPHCQLNLLYIFGSIYQVCCNTSEPAFPFSLLHYPLPIHLMSQWILAVSNFLSITFRPYPFFACVLAIFSLWNIQLSILFLRLILNVS